MEAVVWYLPCTHEDRGIQQHHATAQGSFAKSWLHLLEETYLLSGFLTPVLGCFFFQAISNIERRQTFLFAFYSSFLFVCLFCFPMAGCCTLGEFYSECPESLYPWLRLGSVHTAGSAGTVPWLSQVRQTHWLLCSVEAVCAEMGES